MLSYDNLIISNILDLASIYEGHSLMCEDYKGSALLIGSMSLPEAGLVRQPNIFFGVGQVEARGQGQNG